MKTSTLHEASKFASGVIAADFITLAWLYSTNLLPMTFLGINFTPEMAVVGMVFDVVIFVSLVHYGWRTNLPTPSIHKRSFFALIGILLGVVSVLHLLRLVFNIDVTIGNWEAPLWLSWIGTIVTGYLSIASFMFSKSK